MNSIASVVEPTFAKEETWSRSGAVVAEGMAITMSLFLVQLIDIPTLVV